MAYHSHPEEKDQNFEISEMEATDVSSDVLVTAIGVKCSFAYRINANQEKMPNIANELLEEGLETIHFKGLFLKNLAGVRPGLKFWELVNNMRTKPSTFFEKDLSDSFSVIIKVDKNRRFCHL